MVPMTAEELVDRLKTGGQMQVIVRDPTGLVEWVIDHLDQEEGKAIIYVR